MKLFLLFLTLFFSITSYGNDVAKIRNQYKNLFNFQELDKIKLKKNIKIAIIDTGIDPKNKFFKKNIWVPSFIKMPKAYGWDVVSNNAYPLDQHGHGSHVAGIILSIFPKAKIFAINYYQSNKTSVNNLNSEQLFTQAIKLAVKAEVDIINISGGGIGANQDEFLALKEAEKKGIIIVSAAGNNFLKLSNENTQKNYYPASYPVSNIISVMNHLENIKVPSSNYGPLVTISAPGFEIMSFDHKGKITKMTGTSQSTPVITGLIAYLKSIYPQITTEELKLFIKLGTKKINHFIEYNQNGGVIDGQGALFALSKFLKFKKGKWGPEFDQLEQTIEELKKQQRKVYIQTAIAKAIEDDKLFSKLLKQENNLTIMQIKTQIKLQKIQIISNQVDLSEFESYFKNKRSFAAE